MPILSFGFIRETMRCFTSMIQTGLSITNYNNNKFMEITLRECRVSARTTSRFSPVLQNKGIPAREPRQMAQRFATRKRLDLGIAFHFSLPLRRRLSEKFYLLFHSFRKRHVTSVPYREVPRQKGFEPLLVRAVERQTQRPCRMPAEKGLAVKCQHFMSGK
jgi:hypothetical protein